MSWSTAPCRSRYACCECLVLARHFCALSETMHCSSFVEEMAYLSLRCVQYVVETRKVGEDRLTGATELVGTETKEVDERIKAAPRGERTVVVEDVDVPASTTTVSCMALIS